VWWNAAPVTLFNTIITFFSILKNIIKNCKVIWQPSLLLQTTVIIKTWGCFRAESAGQRQLLGRRKTFYDTCLQVEKRCKRIYIHVSVCKHRNANWTWFRLDSHCTRAAVEKKRYIQWERGEKENFLNGEFAFLSHSLFGWLNLSVWTSPSSSTVVRLCCLSAYFGSTVFQCLHFKSASSNKHIWIILFSST